MIYKLQVSTTLELSLEGVVSLDTLQSSSFNYCTWELSLDGVVSLDALQTSSFNNLGMIWREGEVGCVNIIDFANLELDPIQYCRGHMLPTFLQGLIHTV